MKTTESHTQNKKKKLMVKLVGFDKPTAHWFTSSFKSAMIHLEPYSIPEKTNWRDLQHSLKAVLWVISSASIEKGSGDFVRYLLSTSSPIVVKDKTTGRGDFERIRNLLYTFFSSLSTERRDEAVARIRETSGRDLGEVITQVELSERGLSVSFADGEVAVVPHSEIAQLAGESELDLQNIRISENRDFLMIRTRGTDFTPIPQDILRKYLNKPKMSRRTRISTVQSDEHTRQLGSLIRKARISAEFSQAKLAEQVGASRWTIIRLEKGEYLPKVKLLRKIAAALSTDITELLGVDTE